MINKIRTYAPYVYMSRRTLGGYNLYLIIPVGAGETILFPPLEEINLNGNSEKTINSEVIIGTDNILEVEELRFAKKHYIINSSTDTGKITIFVKNGDTSNYRNISRLENVTDTEPLNVDDLATNCPYTYLTKKDDYFYPRVLIPVYGLVYTNDEEDLTVENGICKSTIFLGEAILTTLPSIVAPNKINAASYLAESFAGMEVETVNDDQLALEGTTATKKKGKIIKEDTDIE